MKFEYDPANPDDWPDVINVTVSGVDDGDGFEEGETRPYVPDWRYRVACGTIREQRERIKKLGAAVQMTVDCNHEVAWNNGLCSAEQCPHFSQDGDNAYCSLEKVLDEARVRVPERPPHRLTSERIAALMVLASDLLGAVARSDCPQDEARALTARCAELGIGVPDEVEY